MIPRPRPSRTPRTHAHTRWPAMHHISACHRSARHRAPHPSAHARTSDAAQIVANTSHVSATQAPGADAMRTCRHDKGHTEQRATSSHVAATQPWTRPAPVCLRMAPPDVHDVSLCAARLACLPTTVPLGVAASSSAPAPPPPHPVRPPYELVCLLVLPRPPLARRRHKEAHHIHTYIHTCMHAYVCMYVGASRRRSLSTGSCSTGGCSIGAAARRRRSVRGWPAGL